MTEITPIYNGPFGKMPELRLAYVPRWAIIKMSKEQSVAEHSFNVACIVRVICEELDHDDETTNELMVEALYHDYDEHATGDIPAPAKVDSGTAYHHEAIKMADLLESYRFCNANCTDIPKVKKWVLYNIHEAIHSLNQELNLSIELISMFTEGEV